MTLLALRVENIPGAAVEHNKFCVSVHFRNCSPESYEHVVGAVKDTLSEHPNLKASRGRKVLEIQPQVSPCCLQDTAACLVADPKLLGKCTASIAFRIYVGLQQLYCWAFTGVAWLLHACKWLMYCCCSW